MNLPPWSHEALALAIVAIGGAALRFSWRAFKGELREMIRDMLGEKVEDHEKRITALETRRLHGRV